MPPYPVPREALSAANDAILKQVVQIDADIQAKDIEIAKSEASINALTYRLYKLEEEDIRMVEGSRQHIEKMGCPKKWIADVKQDGFRSIACLLAKNQLRFYDTLSEGGLTRAYRSAGLEVWHYPVEDH